MIISGWPPMIQRINPYGGAIALGHPLASSGRTPDDSSRAGVSGASGGPLWAHHDVHRSRDGRHGDLGESPLLLRRGGCSVRTDELEQLILEASASSEGEVVTRALSRDITLPRAAGTAVLITLDNGRGHTRPNTLGAHGLGELNRALDARSGPQRHRRDRDHWKAIHAGRGRRPHRIRQDRQIATRHWPSPGSAMPSSTSCGRLRVPTFAFINGLALGGGFGAHPALPLPDGVGGRLGNRSARIRH